MSTMDVFIKVISFIYVLYVMFTTIHSENLTWFEAQRCCASRAGLLASTTDPIVSCNNIPSHAKTLWTGNIRIRSKWIEFQGCYGLNGKISLNNNISECYKWCLHGQHPSFKSFAFKENRCICHVTITQTDAYKYMYLCNNRNIRNYSWVYKVLYNASYDGYGNCVVSKCSNGSEKKVAESCTSLYTPRCGEKGTKVLNWTDSQSYCKNITTDVSSHNKSTSNTGVWTNMFRVEILSHVNHDKIDMTEISSCVIAKCVSDVGNIKPEDTNCNETADAFYCKQVVNTTIISSLECKSQTTNIYNISKPHTIADTTVTSSSVSRHTHQLSSRTQNQNSTEALTTVNTDIGKTTATISASITKFISNSVSKRTAHSSFLVTGITSVKLQVVHSVDVTTTRRPSHKTTNITPIMDEQVGTKPEATNIGLICGVTVGGLVLIAVIAVIACKMRNVGPFRKQLYNDDTIEMNNSIECAIPVYHDTVLNTGNGSVPKDAIRNNTADDTSTSTGERKNKASFSNHEYDVVVKKHPPGPATQPRRFDLEEDDNQGQRFETEDEYNTLKHTVDKGEEHIENNVYDSSLGVRDGVDPTYNSITIGQVNNDTTYDHTSNIVQKQVNSDRTYDLTSNIVQKQVNNDATYDHTF